MLGFHFWGFAQVKVENDGSLFVNSHKGNWGRANWTKVHFQNTCAYHLSNTFYDMDVFYVMGDGHVWTRQGYLTSSDKEFKINIENVRDALSITRSLRGVTYNRKYTIDTVVQSKDNPHRFDSIVRIEKFEPKEYGLIAQEVKDVVPELVYTMQDSSLAISYQSIIPILIEAIKEQQCQIEKLQATLILYGNMIKESNATNGYDNEIQNAQKKQANKSALFQNAPNPFKEKTSIIYFLDETIKEASVLVYDINGRLMKSLAISEFGQGSVELEAGELVAGVYVCALMADGVVVDTKQMILTK